MSKRSGAVYILALIAMTGLTALVAGLAVQQRVSSQARQNRVDEDRLALLSDSALARAEAELSLLTSGSPVTLNDDWALLGSTGNDLFIVGNGEFRMEIVDAASRIDLNSATEAQLLKLGMLQDQVDALLDWREAGQVPRGQGAKDEVYNALTTPYNAKTAPFDSVNELLLVRGFTAADLYQPPADPPADLVTGDTSAIPAWADILTVDSESVPLTGGGTQDIAQVNSVQQMNQIVGNQQLAQALFNQRQQFTTMGQVLQVPGMTLAAAGNILNRLTVGSATSYTGRINLNTASEVVLNTLPEFNTSLTDSVISRQEAGMTQLSELAELPGMTLTTLAAVIDQVTLTSETFIVRIQARWHNQTRETEVVLSTSGGEVRPLRSEIISPGTAETRWNWPAETGAEVELVAAS